MISAELTALCEAASRVPQGLPWQADGGPRFQVNKATTRAGSLYERLRYLIDYRDEHTIRAAAIERILRRLQVTEGKGPLGKKLLAELVQVGYIDNDTIPESCAHTVDRFLGLAERLGEKTHIEPVVLRVLVAHEIERYLFPNPLPDLVAETMHAVLLGYMKPKGAYSAERFSTELFVAVRSALLEESEEALLSALLRRRFGDWWAAALHNPAVLQEVADQLDRAVSETRACIASPVVLKIVNRIKNESLYFYFIRLLLEEKPQVALDVLSDREALAHFVEEKTRVLYPGQRHKIKGSGKRAVLYLFLTKILVGLSLELPYDLLVVGAIHYPALLINTLFFPLLLLVMVYSARYPGSDNTEKIIAGILHVIHVPQAGRKPEFVPTAPWSASQKFLIGSFYVPLFILSFGTIVMILNALHFNIVSQTLFIFFLCVVSYFGLRLRYRAKRYLVEENDESTWRFMLYLARLPIVRTGRWLSLRLSRINVLVLVMDAIIETPFKILLGSFDQFVTFVKETRRDVQ